MSTHNPMQPCERCGQPHPKCTAHNRAGDPCGNNREPGQTVCRMHGGAAPKAQAAARMRLLEMIDPALHRLMTELNNEDAKPAERLRAVENVLDRTGLGRQVTMDDDTARALLLERLAALKQQQDDTEAGEE